MDPLGTPTFTVEKPGSESFRKTPNRLIMKYENERSEAVHENSVVFWYHAVS